MSEEVERLLGPSRPMPVFRKGTEVKVYLGAGWAKGKVSDSTRDACSVWLSQQRRTTRCHDARNIQSL